MLADLDLENYYKEMYIMTQDFNFSLNEIENMPAYELDFYNILVNQRQELERMEKLNR